LRDSDQSSAATHVEGDERLAAGSDTRPRARRRERRREDASTLFDQDPIREEPELLDTLVAFGCAAFRDRLGTRGGERTPRAAAIVRHRQLAGEERSDHALLRCQERDAHRPLLVIGEWAGELLPGVSEVVRSNDLATRSHEPRVTVGHHVRVVDPPSGAVAFEQDRCPRRTAVAGDEHAILVLADVTGENRSLRVEERDPVDVVREDCLRRHLPYGNRGFCPRPAAVIASIDLAHRGSDP
jgi:hypothetical protein